MQNRVSRGARLALAVVALSAVAAPPAGAQTAPVDLTTLSLESLLSMRITSVSREEQEFLRTPAAVYVITRQDIERSGATDIAELLRMVPGVHVARINQSTWAISARGFNAQYSTKMLVLVDGRSVYDPGFSGVWWHLQNLVLEDIERIEVIRGPGATMWGANAMNGVISITTRNSERTQGLYASAGAGQGRPGDASIRFGGRLGERAFYRVFARQTSRAASSAPSGAPGGDAWNATDFGLRVDWESTTRDAFTVQASGYRSVTSDRRQIVTSLAPLTLGTAGLTGGVGGHVLGRWTRSFSPRSDLTVQFYHDEIHMTRYAAKEVDTTDLDMQHSFGLGGRQHVRWGAGIRYIGDRFVNSPAFGLTPARETVTLASAFVQDEVTIVPDRLFVAVGSKVEHSSFAGGNVQPAVRLLWQPTDTQSIWASAARAVRTANRVERGMHLDMGGFATDSLPVAVRMLGRDSARSEEMLAREIGYRRQVNRRLWFDVAAFYNTYDFLSLVEPGEPFVETAPAPPHLVMPLYFENNGYGATYGAEITSQYQATDRLAVKGGFTLLRMDLETTGASTAPADHEGQSPRHEGYIGSTLQLSDSVQVSGQVVMVGELPYFAVPAYTRVDGNVFWRITDQVGLRVVGENLRGKHLEFGDLPSPANVVSRQVHAAVVFGF